MNQKGFAAILFLVGILTVSALIIGGAYFYKTKLVKNDKLPAQSTQNQLYPASIPKKTDETANWKTLILDEIFFKYPVNWKDAEYNKTPFGKGAEIKNSDGTQRIVVLEGINIGESEQEISKFVSDSLAVGGTKITLAGTEAVKISSNLGTKLRTVYVGLDDKTTHYSISLEASNSYSDQEMDVLLNQILSTFKFLDQEQVDAELPPLYSKISWVDSTTEKYPFQTNKYGGKFVEKDAFMARSVKIYKNFPPAELVDGFRDYYTDWFEDRGWEMTLYAGGLGGQGGTGSIGYEKDGRYFQFGLPAALSKDSDGKFGFQFYVVHD